MQTILPDPLPCAAQNVFATDGGWMGVQSRSPCSIAIQQILYIFSHYVLLQQCNNIYDMLRHAHASLSKVKLINGDFDQFGSK